MTDDGVRIDLGHPRRTDHHRLRAGIACMTRVLHAGLQAVGGRAGNYRHAAVDVLHDGLEHAAALALGQAGDLARDAERRDAVHTAVNEEVDDALQALVIDLAGGTKRRGKNRENARESTIRRHKPSDMVHELKPSLTW